MRGTALVFASLLLTAGGPAWSQEGGTAALLAACDQVAAAPFDLNRPAGVAGIAGEKIDPAAAIPACEAAAKAAPENPRIAFELGRAYTTAKDYAQAQRWYGSAAQSGYAPAMFTLGRLHHEIMDEKDYGQAKRWYEQAAALGVPPAMMTLGLLHEHGQGVPQDYEQAAALEELFAMVGLGRSIADLDAALKRNPQLAGSRYLRSVARQKRGDAAGGDADIASAIAIEPDIAGRYKRYAIN
jgi:tetratricopeptide (TPR) repeat protein